MAEDKEKIVQTTIRMPTSLKKRLGDAVHARKYTPEQTSIDGMVQWAVSKLLDEIAPEAKDGLLSKVNSEAPKLPSVVPVHLLPTPIGTVGIDTTAGVDPWIAHLIAILNSGHETAMIAIQKNLIAFRELVEGAQREKTAASNAGQTPVPAGKVGSLHQVNEDAKRVAAHAEAHQRGRDRKRKRSREDETGIA